MTKPAPTGGPASRCAHLNSDSQTVIPYSSELRETIANNLANHDRLEVPLEGRRHAAVAVVLVDSEPGDDHDAPDVDQLADFALDPQDRVLQDAERMEGVSGGAAFLLIRRAARMSTHSRQWALPGGRVDEGETATEAALREVHEEVGLLFDQSSVLGLLDDYPTRSGYVMTPIVVWGGGRTELQAEPAEVFATYRVGLTQLQRDDSPRYIEIPESPRPVVQMPLGGAVVHAPTGAVLLQFARVGLDGNVGERVDHLEQPVFAWK